MLGGAALGHGVVVRAPVRAWRWERGIAPAVGDRVTHPRFGDLVVVRLGEGKVQTRDAGATERWLALPK